MVAFAGRLQGGFTVGPFNELRKFTWCFNEILVSALSKTEIISLKMPFECHLQKQLSINT
jgi:hypothetical protein